MKTLSRRHFIAKGVAVGTATVLAKPMGLYAEPLDMPIGLQLYTVRAELKKDLEGTLRTIADIGYRTVETAGLPDGISRKNARSAR